MNKKLFITRAVKVVSFCLIFIYLFSYSYNVLSWKDGSGGYDSAAITLYEELEATQNFGMTMEWEHLIWLFPARI